MHTVCYCVTHDQWIIYVIGLYELPVIAIVK